MIREMTSPRLARPSPRSAFAVGLLLTACGGSSQGPAAGPVPKGSFAAVGDRPLSVALLQRSLGKRSPREASQVLVRDARVALEARAVSPEKAAVVERGQLVRGLVQRLRTESLQRRALQPAELEAVQAALWTELERPRAVRTVNIVAEIPPLGDGAREERVLRRIAEAVRGSPTPEELNRRVEGVPKEGVEVAVLLVAPVTEDGRVYAETPADATYAAPPLEYARAAAALTHVGETSDVVATATGFHVLMALAIVPPLSVAEPERSRRLEQAALDRRIDVELQRLRQDLSARTQVWQNPHRATLTSLVWRASSGP